MWIAATAVGVAGLALAAKTYFDLRSERADRQAALDSAKNAGALLKAEGAKVAALIETAQMERAQLAELQRIATANEEEVKALEGVAAAQRSQLEALQRAAATSDKQVIALEASAAALRKHLEELERTADASEEQVDQLEKLVNLAKQYLQDQRKLVEDLRVRIERLESRKNPDPALAQAKLDLESRKLALQESETSWKKLGDFVDFLGGTRKGKRRR